MTDDETFIRQAIATQAERAADSSVVLAGLQRPRRSRRWSFALATAAGVIVAAAVVIPLATKHEPPALAVAAPPAAIEQNVLLAGLDGSGRADSVVLARLSADGTLRAVSLPRDSWVEIPGRGMGRLNSAEGIGGLVATVQALTGIRIDHYATVDMAGFGSLSTAVGGVDVCLRAASHDSFSGADFPAGRQTLSGPRALAFLRQRAGLPNGDLDRVVRQQDFLRALVAKVSSGDTLRDPKALAALLTAVRENVEVDQGWDLAAFARQLAANPAAGLATIPVTIRNDAGTLNLDPGAVRIFVGDFLAGTPKPGNDSAGSPPVDPCVG